MEKSAPPFSSPTSLLSSATPSRNGIAAFPPLTPVRAEPDRLERLTVCTRPFRAQGPRLESERLGDKLLIHNYGHGGAGWSLSWGYAALVASIALAESREIAVVGCGALGLTAALTLQRAGANVTIYARDLPSKARSARATGIWSPDSRFALAASADAGVAQRWEQTARQSWTTFTGMLDLPGRPIAMHHRYELSDLPPGQELNKRHREDPIGFAHFESRIEDLYPPFVDLGPDPAGDAATHPFPVAWCRHEQTLRYNLTALIDHLWSEFHERGGRFQQIEFHSPQDLATLPEPVLVHCTGYDARTLFNDTSLTPVRGQIGWLPAQPGVDYSLSYGKNNMVGREDGIVIQVGASSDATGWNDPSETPIRTESETAVRWLADLQRRTSRPASRK